MATRKAKLQEIRDIALLGYSMEEMTFMFEVEDDDVVKKRICKLIHSKKNLFQK